MTELAADIGRWVECVMAVFVGLLGREALEEAAAGWILLGIVLVGTAVWIVFG